MSHIWIQSELYCDKQKTMEKEEDIIAILRCIWWCYKANSFTRHFYCEMGLFTLHNCCVSRFLNFLKLKLDSQSRLTIPEFSSYHCTSEGTDFKSIEERFIQFTMVPFKALSELPWERYLHCSILKPEVCSIYLI